MGIDVTEAKTTQMRLSALAEFDTLTGLANRARMQAWLDAALARAKQGATVVACLFLDIDHFKEINDSCGHAAGDEALQEFGRRLQACVRETDLVDRLAGDEFVIAMEKVTSAAPAEATARKIIDAMLPPFVIGAANRSLDEHRRGAFKRADHALYRAKREGRGRFAVDDAAPEKGV